MAVSSQDCSVCFMMSLEEISRRYEKARAGPLTREPQELDPVRLGEAISYNLERATTHANTFSFEKARMFYRVANNGLSILIKYCLKRKEPFLPTILGEAVEKIRNFEKEYPRALGDPN